MEYKKTFKRTLSVFYEKNNIGFNHFIWISSIYKLFSGLIMLRDGLMENNDNSGMMEDVNRHFIEKMIPHHEDAIAMADIALKKA